MAPELVETAAMRDRTRYSLSRRARTEKIRENRERKEMLRRQACELVDSGRDAATIAASWNSESVGSLAPSRIPWSAKSVANLIRSPALVP